MAIRHGRAEEIPLDGKADDLAASIRQQAEQAHRALRNGEDEIGHGALLEQHGFGRNGLVLDNTIEADQLMLAEGGANREMALATRGAVRHLQNRRGVTRLVLLLNNAHEEAQS